MFATTRDEDALVIAAQRGDRRAMETLVAEYMPLVYNIVGLALDHHGDVDDVVQESLIRVVDHLGELRDPAAFRSWLVAITVRQVRDRWRARRTAPLMMDSAGLASGEATDPGADFVDLTILRLALADQRRETALATRWLEPDDRELLTLWWLESAGELSRAELADALDLPLSHTAVRIQRMKAQLDAARTVVRALAVPQRCAEFAAMAASWDGNPSSVWRKRFARHTRDCVACGSHWNDLVPAERLLAGLSLVPVPALLAAKWLGFALAGTAPSTGVGAGATTAGAERSAGHGGTTGGTSLQAGRLAAKVVGRRRLLKAAVFGGAGVGVAGVAAAMMSKTAPTAQATSILTPKTSGAPLTTAASASPSASASASVTHSEHPSATAHAAASASATPTATGFVHPGLLHTDADFARMTAKVNAGAQPWAAGWKRLTGSSLSQSTWKANPQVTVYRGSANQDNYPAMYYDIHAAYQNGLRWKITGDAAHGNAARDILNAWSSTMKTLTGDADRFIAAGIYGYQWCNAAELMRGYPGFDLDRFKAMMLNIFYPMNDSFLTNHNGAFISNYWASWDQLTIASILAIGILCDDTAKVDQAVNYFKNGKGMGAIKNAVPVRFSDGLGEWAEAGRDQGHATLGVGLTAAICEMAWSQGIDLYGYDDNLFMAGAEYVAQYNMGGSVPYTSYTWYYGAPGVWSGSTTFTAASPDSRGAQRPIWEMIYNHYARRQGLSVPAIAAYAASMRPEGGGGDYGGASGGFDQLGHGTLTYTI
jgi:RNA polymerase sigma factor (sigma-70 family)